jgi:DNA-binding CsgD family transcriptional regulator
VGDLLAVLAPRQQQVLSLLAEGDGPQAVETRQGLTGPTVRNHVAAVLHRLGCHSQLEAVAEARRQGLL